MVNYLKKRFFRIYPTYWIILLTVYCIAFATHTLPQAVPTEPSTWLKTLLLIPQDKSVVGGTGAPILIVAWTLQYEIVFYLLFSLFLLSKKYLVIAGTLLLFIFWNFCSQDTFAYKFLANNYILLFTMGVGVSAMSTSVRLIGNWPILFTFLGLMILCSVGLDNMTNFNLFNGKKTLLNGLASCLIILGLVQAENNKKIYFNNEWVSICGDSSYALYLIHYPLIIFLCKLSLLIHLDSLGFIGAILCYFMTLYLCLITSCLFHQWIEKPIASYFRHKYIKQTLNVQS